MWDSQCRVLHVHVRALSQWHDTIHLQKKGSEGVFVECYCDKTLTCSSNYLTSQHLLKCLLDGDRQVMSSQKSWFGILLWAVPSILKKKNNCRKIIKYMAHI